MITHGLQRCQFPIHTTRNVRFSCSLNVSHTSGISFGYHISFHPSLPPSRSGSLKPLKPWSHPLPRNPLIVLNTFHSGSGAGLEWTGVTAQLVPERLGNEKERETDGTGKQPSARRERQRNNVSQAWNTVCSGLFGISRALLSGSERGKDRSRSGNKQSVHSGQVLVGCRPENSMTKPVAKVDQLVEGFFFLVLVFRRY